MPWKTDKNGDKKYVVSIYAKEELPTWSEIYEEFYKKKLFIYDPDDAEHQILDLYWKIPRRKYLLATVCNQFNKMLFEDGLLPEMIKFASSEAWNCCDIRFTCEPIEDFDIDECEDGTCEEDYERFVIKWKSMIDSTFLGLQIPPPIYTIPMPNGEANPFITSAHPRININDLNTKLCIVPVLKLDDSNNSYSIHAPLPWEHWNVNDYSAIMDFMMQRFKDYFEGEGVGWKNKEGHLVETDPLKRSCDRAGFDPAL